MRNFRAGKLAARSVVAMLVAFGLLLSALPTKAGASGGTFPIGIFFPPGAQATTQAKYAEIAGMNANFIVGAGVLVTPEANGPALDMAQANGLKLLASDFRLHWRDEHLAQSANGAGLWVSSGNSLGQTFKSPVAGTQWYITGVKLNIDIGNWPAGVKLTLSIYDSPAKGTLLGSSSITGPASTYFPSFSLSKPVVTNTTYYMELTSDSTTAIGWVATSTGDAYGNGTAYQQGAALGRDLWFDVSFAQLAYNDGHRPSDSDIDAIVGQYGAHPALLGYHLYDEPSADLLSRLQSVQRRIEQQQPGAFTFLNLLPIYATPAQWNVGSVSGDFARPNRVLGQKFRTAPGQNAISTLQLWIDHLTWGAGEALTLKLWNSPAKQSLIAQSTLTSSTTDWPVFTLNAAVAPSTDYYGRQSRLRERQNVKLLVAVQAVRRDGMVQDDGRGDRDELQRSDRQAVGILRSGRRQIVCAAGRLLSRPLIKALPEALYGVLDRAFAAGRGTSTSLGKLIIDSMGRGEYSWKKGRTGRRACK